MRGLNARLQVLEQEQKDKKYDEISEAERKDLQECRDAIAAEEAKQKKVLATFANGNAVIPQLIDLALLQSGLLKGSELNRFIKRSIELMK
jgi:molecular chaperone HtpG